MSTLRVTVYRTPDGASGPPYCWRTEHHHGQADSPDDCVRDAHHREADRVEAAANSLAVELADMRAKVAGLRATMPVDVPSGMPL